MKIIVTEKISDKGVALLQAVPDFDVDVRFDIEREELLKIILNMMRSSSQRY